MNLEKMLFMAGMTFLLPALSFAQNEVKKNRSTIIETHSDTILIRKGDRNVKVKIYEEWKEGEEVRSEEIFSGVSVDYVNTGKSSFLKVLPFVPNRKKKNQFEVHYPFFYLGFGRGTADAFSYSSRFPQRSGKSVDWGFNLYHSALQLDKKSHWGLTWTLGFAYSRYVFDAEAALEKVNGNMVWQPAPEGMDYQKSWMRYWSFRVPVSIEWQKKIKGSCLYFSAGPEVEFRFAMKSKVKYDGHDHTLTGNPNANVIGANLLLQAGYGCLSFNARFGLTPLMDNDRAPRLYHSSIGFGIDF